MCESLYSWVAPSFHGAVLLAVLLNHYPDVASLDATYSNHRFVRICSCGDDASQCLFCTRVGEQVGTKQRMVKQHASSDCKSALYLLGGSS
jgi:hypothetical protein